MDVSQLPLLLGTAVLLPLASFFVILVAGPLLKKEHGAYWATGAIVLAGVLSYASLAIWLASAGDASHGEHAASEAGHHAELPAASTFRLVAAADDAIHAASSQGAAGEQSPAAAHGAAAEHGAAGEHAQGDDHAHGHGHVNGPPRHINGTYYLLGQFGRLRLEISYYIDALTIGMFCVVTLIASCIHFYAMGYMHDELHEVTDHEVHMHDGSHLHRPGRFYRFFQYLSLFCFSMLGLVLAGNIAMVFVFWELVGICSYFLIGFYVERQSASNAANKAFIVNRVGDFGMIIGLMAVWTGLGTFAFGDSLGPHGGHLVDIRNMATAATSHHAEWSADEQTGSVIVHLLDLAQQPVEAEGADLAIEVLWQGETTRFPLAADSGHLTASDADLAAALLPLSEWTRPRLVGKLRGEDVTASLSRQDGIFSRLRPADHDYQIQLPVSMAAAAAPLAVSTEGQSLAEIARQWRAATTQVPAESPSLVGNGWRWALDWLRYGAIQTVNILPTVQIEAERPETLGGRLGPFHAGYWLLIVAGVGIFCGCVGKSAQFPLHVWLPDAMEGPTPVSALVHSATMVAAGVYLVGRFFPTFTPEVLLVIASAGCITLFIAATIAITATDIKRVLAYSTISQLGYMMLALGLGGWLAGLMHLVTHAFFKSLLFLCSGSVIHAVHTNEMPKMGGLLRKMPITGITMLVGCLAIAGISVPFVVGFSGYYSKDAILEQAFAFMQQNPGSFFGPLLFVTAAGGAAMTAFYMFRLWFMTFVGQPRDHHRYDHAHESPKVMYVPLIILAVLATGVAWPGPTEAVYVAVAAVLLAAGLYGYGKLAGGEGDSQGHFQTVAYTLLGSAAGLLVLAGLWSVVGINLHDLLEQARPAGTTVNTQGVLARLVWPDEHFAHQPPQFWTIVFPVTMLATATAVGGILLAAVIYAWGYLSPADIRRQFEPVYRLLWNKWWFDELYGWLFVRPVTWISQCAAGFDRRWIDGFIDSTAWGVAKFARIWERIADQNVVDGLVNGLADWTFRIGLSLRILQTGRLRQYVMFIVIAALAIFVLISVFWSPTLAQ